METISRRTALAGGTALVAAAVLPAAASGNIVPIGTKSAPTLPAHADAALFAAIARWREARDIYEAESARQNAICARADAEMPEYGVLMRAHFAALHAEPFGQRTPEQCQRVGDTDAALKPVSKAYHRRIKALGFDEDKTGDLSSACTDACDAAFAIPARTLAGLRAKLEMQLAEYDYNTFGDGATVAVLVADIRRLAGRAGA